MNASLFNYITFHPIFLPKIEEFNPCAARGSQGERSEPCILDDQRVQQLGCLTVWECVSLTLHAAHSGLRPLVVEGLIVKPKTVTLV